MAGYMPCDGEHSRCRARRHPGSTRGRDERCVGGLVRRVGHGAAEEERKGRKNGAVHCVGYAAQTVRARFYRLATAFTYRLCGRYQSGVPDELPPTLVLQVKPYITTSDISVLSQALSLLAALLDLAPSTTFPAVERELLSDIYPIAHSPLVSGAALDALLSFFSALVQADLQIATHVVPNLVIAVEKGQRTDANMMNVAKCVGEVVRSQQGVAAGTIAEYSRYIKVGCGCFVDVACLMADGLSTRNRNRRRRMCRPWC